MLRSNAYDRLSNGEEPEEIATAITEQLREALPEVIANVLQELQPFDVDDRYQRGQLTAAIASFLKLAGGGWSAEQRQEWMSAAAHELAEFPVQLLLPAIARARRKVRFTSEFVPWIVEQIEPDLATLRDQATKFNRLLELAA